MAKYRDRRNAGRSAFVPYRPGESWKDRHQRRLRHALRGDIQKAVAKWCDRYSVHLEIKNDGQHWIMNPSGWPLRPDGSCPLHFAQWWPSSAKLIPACMWSEGVHCHDTEQVLTQLRRWLSRGGFATAALNYAENNRKRSGKRS